MDILGISDVSTCIERIGEISKKIQEIVDIKNNTDNLINSLQTINNKRHIEVSTEDGTKHLVPANKIKKPRESKSGYNDEHAMVKVWNHFIDHSKENMNNENKMSDYQDALEKIRGDQRYQDQMNLKRESEMNKKMQTDQKLNIDREKLQTQKQIADKQLQIAKENKNKYDSGKKAK